MEAITKARKMQSHIMQLMYLIAYDNISAPPPQKKNPEKKTNKLKNKNKTITLMLPHLQASVQGYHSVRKKKYSLIKRINTIMLDPVLRRN